MSVITRTSITSHWPLTFCMVLHIAILRAIERGSSVPPIWVIIMTGWILILSASTKLNGVSKNSLASPCHRRCILFFLWAMLSFMVFSLSSSWTNCHRFIYWTIIGIFRAPLITLSLTIIVSPLLLLTMIWVITLISPIFIIISIFRRIIKLSAISGLYGIIVIWVSWVFIYMLAPWMLFLSIWNFWTSWALSFPRILICMLMWGWENFAVSVRLFRFRSALSLANYVACEVTFRPMMEVDRIVIILLLVMFMLLWLIFSVILIF